MFSGAIGLTDSFLFAASWSEIPLAVSPLSFCCCLAPLLTRPFLCCLNQEKMCTRPRATEFVVSTTYVGAPGFCLHGSRESNSTAYLSMRRDSWGDRRGKRERIESESTQIIIRTTLMLLASGKWNSVIIKTTLMLLADGKWNPFFLYSLQFDQLQSHLLETRQQSMCWDRTAQTRNPSSKRVSVLLQGDRNNEQMHSMPGGNQSPKLELWR